MKSVYGNLAFIILSLSIGLTSVGDKKNKVDVFAAKPPSFSTHKNKGSINSYQLNFIGNGPVLSDEDVDIQVLSNHSNQIQISIKLNTDAKEKLVSTFKKFSELRFSILHEGEILHATVPSHKQLLAKDTLTLTFSNFADKNKIQELLT